MAEITKIVELNKASGEGKFGTWHLSLVEVDDVEMGTFIENPVVGMQVKVEEKDGKKTAKKLTVETSSDTNQQIASNEINDKLDRIIKGLAQIYKEVSSGNVDDVEVDNDPF